MRGGGIARTESGEEKGRGESGEETGRGERGEGEGEDYWIARARKAGGAPLLG
jgi:hypothetical protein